MKSPSLSIEHPDRINELEQLMEFSIGVAMDEALSAGWDINEIDCAVRSLAHSYLKRHVANANTDRQIAEALGRSRKMN